MIEGCLTENVFLPLPYSVRLFYYLQKIAGLAENDPANPAHRRTSLFKFSKQALVQVLISCFEFGMRLNFFDFHQYGG